MREETHNYAFLMKIYEGPDDDSHETAYWACWRIIRCDPDSGMVYLKPHDASGRIDLGKKYLFCEFSYIPDEGPGEYTVNYTDIRPYPLTERGEVYDPPDGIKLCAKYNATVYRKARNKWDQLKEEERQQDPVSSRLSNLIAYHQRIVADCREWFRVSFPQYLSELSGKPHESERTAYTRFEDLVRLALNAGQQSDEELWEWKRRFDEFRKSYFCRYEERHGKLNQGPGAGNGLEWRTYRKFRKQRRKKSNLRT